MLNEEHTSDGMEQELCSKVGRLPIAKLNIAEVLKR